MLNLERSNTFTGYGTIHNPTVKRGPDRQPKIKPLPKEKAEDMTQTQGKDKSH